MSLREKRPGYWEVRVYAGTDPVSGKRRSVARGLRGTKRDAKRLEAALLHEVAERPVTETEGTLLFACNQVIDHLEQIGRSPTTIDSYRQLTDGRIAERIGAIRLCDLTTRTSTASTRRCRPRACRHRGSRSTTDSSTWSSTEP